MDLIVSIVLLCLSLGARSETLHDALNKRGDIYTNDFGGEFESIAYAAVPLHQPMSIVHIVSPSVKYKRFPYGEDLVHTTTHHYYARRPAHSSAMTGAVTRTGPSPSSSELKAPEVIYARPNKRGGYTYRRPKPAHRPPVEPFVIRVHKYKVVRNR